jgi:hypothetical protein
MALQINPRLMSSKLLHIAPSMVLAFCLQALAEISQPPAGAPQGGAAHRVFQVTAPDAKGAVEVSVAINPTNPDHMIAVSIQIPQKTLPGVHDFAYVTKDAGKTWKTVPCAAAQGLQQGDDVITFTADGLAIHGYLAFTGIRQPRPNKAATGILTSTTRDGLTWDAPAVVINHQNSVEPFEDKPWIKADHSKDSPHRGNIYVTWTKFDVYGSKKPEHKSHIYVASSLDSGKTFSVAHRISEVPGDCIDKGNTLMGSVPTVGPNGEVYAVWGGPDGLVFCKSTDAGYTFGKNKIITDTPAAKDKETAAKLGGGWEFPIKGLGRANGSPSAGVDISPGKDRGSVYVCWADMRNGDPDVFLIVSRDGGETWAKPLRVNDDAVGNGKEQWFPWMVVDPADGSVNIAYYDRGPYAGTQTGVTLARSVDGGRTFKHHPIKQEPFDLDKVGFFGDYLGIDALGGRVAVLFMRPFEANRLGISGAVFDFDPSSQEARVEKK